MDPTQQAPQAMMQPQAAPQQSPLGALIVALLQQAQQPPREIGGQAPQAGMRSESTQNEIARRGADAAARPMSAVGRMVWPEEAAIRDGKRAPFLQQMQQTGPY